MLLVLFSRVVTAQESHNHAAPEKLGAVSFPISCRQEVQQQFNRGVAFRINSEIRHSLSPQFRQASGKYKLNASMNLCSLL